MPKTKLKFPKADRKKLEVAAHYSNVRLGQSIEIGNDMIVEVQAPDFQNILDADRLRTHVTGNELDAAKQPAAPVEKPTKK